MIPGLREDETKHGSEEGKPTAALRQRVKLKAACRDGGGCREFWDMCRSTPQTAHQREVENCDVWCLLEVKFSLPTPVTDRPVLTIPVS
ncbi:hypothetical protein AAFF_G00356480 [Aldrovandia affinis]|uniref:Uncharacterized protein n=1 Tax=Aldrovandia affinis TaxID=143900 RepID=A0AAD7T8M1_9TELE|nr:hypothetical protein AAFF_G00356480 [Aldrovandia affinis]